MEPPGVAAASVSGSIVTVRPVGPGIATATVTARDPAGLSFLMTATVGPDLEVRVRGSVAVALGEAEDFEIADGDGPQDAAAVPEPGMEVQVSRGVPAPDARRR